MTELPASRSILIIGASSLLGRELARNYAASGWRVILAGRDADELGRVASDVAIRERAMVEVIAVDLADTVSIDAAALEVLRKGIPKVIIFVAGAANRLSEAPFDPKIAQSLLAANYVGPTRLVSVILPALRSAPGTMIAFVSSVAGDRGRRTNFIYGAAKAALNTYCQGLRALLVPNNVDILTIKLGYMDTRLSYGVAPPALTCSPAYAAKAIRRAIERRRMIVYVPSFWRWICFALRAIPEYLFIRLPIP
jgi:decaprenylphospho-beta-D-erythro-pentofuranosid-2-ulose 2-reductase